MKIVQLVSGTGVNGAVLQCYMLSRALHERGHDVTVIGRSGSWLEQKLSSSGIHFLSSTLKRWPLGEFRRIADWIRQNNVDVLHTHKTSAQLFGVLLKAFVRVPVVATAHHTHMHAYWMFNDFVIANSDMTKRMEIRWNCVRPSRIETVRCLIEHEAATPHDDQERAAWRKQHGFSPDDKIIGIVGDVVPRKNHRLLMRALPDVLAAVPNAKVAVAGNQFPQYTDQVKQDLQQLGIADAVTFVGFQDDIPRLMRSIDCLVACPTDEPFGLTPPEAMAAGRPVVATAVGGLVESVVDGETGYLVPSQDASSLGSALKKVLSDDYLAAKLGAAGRDRFLQMFDNVRNVARHEEIFAAACRAVLKRDPSPSRSEIQKVA